MSWMTPEQHLARIQAAKDAGLPLDLLPFRRHETTSGTVDAGCLSQWWPVDFTVGGVTYPSAEHWMMAEKARLFGDEARRAVIMESNNPAKAQIAGRKVRGFDESRWAAARYDIVVAGNLATFGQHPDLRDFLLGTGTKVLVEASPYDRIWGIGLAADAPDTGRPSRWRGSNLLGFALMEVRERQ